MGCTQCIMFDFTAQTIHVLLLAPTGTQGLRLPACSLDSLPRQGQLAVSSAHGIHLVAPVLELRHGTPISMSLC